MIRIVAFPFPVGVSGLIDPDDEPTIAFLELCAEARRRLGLPSYSRDDVERLFACIDAPAPAPPPLPPNVIRFPSGGRAARSRDPFPKGKS
jgi:hypothetical protein